MEENENGEDGEGSRMEIDPRDSEIETLKEEVASWRSKFKTMELKKRESDLSLNKIKTEINSLRSVDKNWKESAKTVYNNLNGMRSQFFSQIDQVVNGLKLVSKAGERIEEKAPYIKGIRITISKLQRKVKEQENLISSLNGQIRSLTTELQEKTKKIERLSEGIEEEVERLCKPMRDKLADCMVQIMKEKSARAQERRHMADLWPDGHLMPSLLMQYRALSEEEKDKRKTLSQQHNANVSLALEVRANVAEARCWEMKYDDYGRAFYEHKKTSETSWEPPLIMSYKPPPGRDEMGNLLANDRNDISNWILFTDSKGQVFYRHKSSQEVTSIPPNAYKRIPEGKSKDVILGEAAQLIISFIKDKISKHIHQQEELKERLENPLSPDERVRKEKVDKAAAAAAATDESQTEKKVTVDELDSRIPLSEYQYDIETVEMLAENLGGSSKSKQDKDPVVLRKESRGFMHNARVRTFDADFFIGPTLYETDVSIMNIQELRGILENLSIIEDKLSAQLGRVRTNLKDFSGVLLGKVTEADRQKERQLQLELKQKEKDRKLERKRLLLEKKNKVKQAREDRQKEMEVMIAERQAEEARKELKRKENDEFFSPDNPTLIGSVEDAAAGGSGSGSGSEGNDGEQVVHQENAENDDIEIENKGPEENLPEVDLTKTEITNAEADEETDPEEVDSESDSDLNLGESIVLQKDYGSILFGDLRSLDSQDENSGLDLISDADCQKLVNFAVFCGFANLRISEYPLDFNSEFSLAAAVREQQQPTLDDEWLTSSFFLTLNREQLDKVRETLSESNGSAGELNTQKILIDSYANTAVSRDKNDPYTSGVRQIDHQLMEQYRVWKQRQLLSTILREQIKKQAIMDSYTHRVGQQSESFDVRKGTSSLPIDSRQSVLTQSKQRATTAFFNDMNLLALKAPPSATMQQILHIMVKEISFDKISRDREISTSSNVFVFLHLGRWSAKTGGILSGPFTLQWLSVGLEARLPVNAIQLNELLLEIIDDAGGSGSLIGSGRVAIHSLLGSNIGADVTFAVDISDRSRKPVGQARVRISADFDFDQQLEGGGEAEAQDPLNLNHLEQIMPGDKDKSVLHVATGARLNMGNDDSDTCGDALRNIVSVLRGDGGKHFVDTLAGSIDVDDLRKGRISIHNKTILRLPDFSSATDYLKRKTNMHRWDVEKICETLDMLYQELDVSIAKTLESVQRTFLEIKAKHRKQESSTEDLKLDVASSQKLVENTRIPSPYPKEPVFPDFPPIPFVVALPTTGGLDSRGKKKKAIPNPQLKALLEEIENGDVDERDPFPIPDPFWPSQAQALKLTKAIAARNSVLSHERDIEIGERNKAMEYYRQDIERWEVTEKKRKVDLEKYKKVARIANLKFDLAMDRANRLRTEFTDMEAFQQLIVDVKRHHETSRDRFRMVRMKHYLEFTRQKEYLDNIRKRLLSAVRARRYALDLPSTAKSSIEFCQLTEQAEEALRVLKVEIFDCRELLAVEGVRLRTLFSEEASACEAEVCRAKVSKELVYQRQAIDQILARYKFEATNLFLTLSKLKIAEAEKDDVGSGTVDDMGTRYLVDKVWGPNPSLQKCQRLIALTLAKINMTEGLGRSAVASQRVLLNVAVAKWSSDLIPVRDSWCENSDFERAKQLLGDSLIWISFERQKLEKREKLLIENERNYFVEIAALRKQEELRMQVHETESLTLAKSSTAVIDVLRKEFKDLRTETDEKIVRLEGSIVELSRECQQVREALLSQAMAFEEKVKLLWAFIHTLQTSVQQMTGKMEMVLEEQQKIAISSKLIAESMRFQLRIERKHSANLMFIIHSQRGTMKYYQELIRKISVSKAGKEELERAVRNKLKQDVWEQVFCFTKLCTDVNALFEFFAARLANLAGSRASMNNDLAKNGAAQVLAALCKSPRPLIRKLAARALGGMGWNGYTETRILLWDSVLYWKIYKANVLKKEKEAASFKTTLNLFLESDNFDAILHIDGKVEEEFVPSGNMSLRTIIKQRRQWALRATRRNEGPNILNQRLINIKDGVIPALLDMCLKDGDADWEICRNAALAISIASYEQQNHSDMIHSPFCIDMIVQMVKKLSDPEVQTHAAVTIANLCHKDETAQMIFGNSGAIEALVDLLTVKIVDVLEASTSALANMTSFCDRNCKAVLLADGVSKVMHVLTDAYTENVLDLDQNDEVQANAAELLSNISRFSTAETMGFFTPSVIDALVLMCASKNKQLKRQVPLVMGNIAQNESCRSEIGVRGGVESLFLSVEDSDSTVQANSLWALCNLMWHPPNQERAGRFITEIVDFLYSTWEPVRTHSSTLLANVLFYNTTNRVRFLEIDGSTEMLIRFVRERDPNKTVVEGALRSILSLSYLDSIALWFGVDGNCIPLFLSYLTPAGFYSRDALRYCLEILCNLCLHHINRKIIFDNNGVDSIVSLHINEDEHIRNLSVQVIEYIGDITPAEVLARQKTDIGLERMVSLASNQDPLVRAVAAESIGEEIWMDNRKQSQAQKIGAVDALLAIAANKDEAADSVVPALFSLRNLLHKNPDGQAQFGYRDGLLIVSNVLKRALTGFYGQRSEEVLESGLTCLTTACVGEERNSRRLLMVGLGHILDLAEGVVSHKKTDFVTLDGKPDVLQASSSAHLKIALQSEGVNALAKALLLMLAPFNYVVCRNCQKKQELRGTSCSNCGNRLLVDVDYKKETFVPKKNAKALPSSPSAAALTNIQPSPVDSTKNNMGKTNVGSNNDGSSYYDGSHRGGSGSASGSRSQMKTAKKLTISSATTVSHETKESPLKKAMLSQTAPAQLHNHKK